MLILAVIVMLLGTVFFLYCTKPYAVYADGTKVEEPCVVKAGEEELFLVEDAKTAGRVLELVMDEYSPDGAHVNSITVDKLLTTDTKTLKRGEEPPQVFTEQEAIAYVLEQNAQEEPLFSVIINAEIGSIDDVKVQKSVENTDELYEGEAEVKQEGEKGSQVVTNAVTSVNGAVLTSEVVDKTVIKEATDKIVYKGTKERPNDTVRKKYDGKIEGKGDGVAIVNYALQFVGNPYVYGGTSLTKGADCSGFVQSIFKHFGIDLPRTGQQVCGKGVSYSEAKPGDLIFYSGHVAIYMGGGKIVHASNPANGICVTSVHYSGKIQEVRRIVE